MVKNRAEKRNARVIKADTGLTYPRAQARLRAGQEPVIPALFLGFGPDGRQVNHRPGKGSVLVISGNSGSGQSVLMKRLAAEAAATADVHLIDTGKDASDYVGIRDSFASVATTNDAAMKLLQHLAAAPRTAPAILFIDYMPYASSVDGFLDAVQGVSAAGVPVILAGQRSEVGLPAFMLERSDRIFTGTTDLHRKMSFFRSTKAAAVEGARFHGVLETADGTVSLLGLPMSGPDDLGEEPTADSTEYRFTFGTAMSGAPVTFMPVRDKHLLVTGPTGSGKTTLLRALAADATASMDVYVAAGFPGEFSTEGAAGFSGTLEEATAMLDGLLAEAQRRMDLCKAAGVAGTGDLPEPPRQVMLVVDDFPSFALTDPRTRGPEEDDTALRARIAVQVGHLAREARMAGITLVIGSQELNDTSAPGVSALTEDMSRLVLGRLDGGFQYLTADLRSKAVRAMRPGTRQGVYDPLGRHGGLVDISRF